MGLARRLALLEWAARAGAWVLEDDYDSEFRYASRPLASLQGAGSRGAGVLHRHLLESAVSRAAAGLPGRARAGRGLRQRPRAAVDRHAPTVEQAALADFITEGHFARRIRRMRALYAERQAALVDAARATLGNARLCWSQPRRACIWWAGLASLCG